MPFRPCRSPGCTLPATSRFSPYCSRHKARARRHGAPEQATITKAALAPHLRRVRARIAKNPESPLWGQLEARWEVVRGHAEGLAAAKGAMSRFERRAAHEVLRLAEAVPPREVVETALAMFVMQAEEPRRFRSDEGFRAQLVRRVRGLSDVNAGSTWDHAEGRVKRVYRELPPRAGAVLGQWLAEAFGAAGLRLAALEQRDRDEAQAERDAFHKALEALE